jgi:hypothetical protein
MMFTTMTALAAATMAVPGTATPAWAHDIAQPRVEQTADNSRRDRRERGSYDRYGRYVEPQPVTRDTRVWRGDDGRYYCRRNNGTTGLIVGGAVGALAGRTIDTRGDRTVGTLLGAAGGAVLGRELERSGSRCR